MMNHSTRFESRGGIGRVGDRPRCLQHGRHQPRRHRRRRSSIRAATRPRCRCRRNQTSIKRTPARCTGARSSPAKRSSARCGRRRTTSAGASRRSSTSDVGSAWSHAPALSGDERARRLRRSSKADRTPPSDINLARAYMNAGFSLILLAETYCRGHDHGRTAADAGADARFGDRAVQAGGDRSARAAATAGVAEGTKVVNASNVGLARASLQKKDYASANTYAALVPAAFVYNAVTVDDASNRAARQRDVHATTSDGRLIVVPDAYRALNDPRVAWRDAGQQGAGHGPPVLPAAQVHGLRDADSRRVGPRGELHRRRGAVADGQFHAGA